MRVEGGREGEVKGRVDSEWHNDCHFYFHLIGLPQ